MTRFTSSIARFRRGLKYALLIFLGLFLLLIIGSAAYSGHLDIGSLPSLSSLAYDEPGILYALGVSFLRVWYVVAICIAVGLPMGVIISLNFRLYDIASPILEVISSIPAPILLPAIVKIPGIGSSAEAVAAIVIFLSVFWYVVFNVMAGVRTLPSDIKALPQVYRVSRKAAWRDVYIPSALTALVTGAITAVGGAWNALIIAEYFQASSGNVLTQVNSGIGKAIAVATLSTPPNYVTLFLAVTSMTVLIVVFNLTVWRRLYHRVTERYTYNR